MTEQAILFMINEKMLKNGHISEETHDKIQNNIITCKGKSQKNRIETHTDSCYNLSVM